MRRQVQNEPYIFIGDDELMTEADKKKGDRGSISRAGDQRRSPKHKKMKEL